MSERTVSYAELKVDTQYVSQGVNVGDFLQNLELKRRQNLLLVPTDDDEVQKMLRQLSEPITVFGEDKGDRRDRLIKLIADKQIDVAGLLGEDKDEDMEDSDEDEDEEFYTPGSEELIEARRYIAQYSIERAKRRIQSETELSEVSMSRQLTLRRKEIKDWQRYELIGSQLVSTRPVSYVTINKLDSGCILTGSWSGDVKLLNKNLEILKEFEPVEGKIGGIDWSPTDPQQFITGGDSLHVWSTGDSLPRSKLEGHDNRVVRSKYHPSGKYIASCSFDQTWRLWNIETEQQLLLQEGHSKEVYTLDFQCDGALLASGGLDAMGYVWDLRTGKSIMTLNGHIKAIHGLAWRDNGYQLATGAADGSIKIWDLRMTRDIATIPAHNKIISEVKFKENLLCSSSYDGTLKLFSSDSWIPVHTLEGHSDKVMSCDIGDDFIVSSGWDRSVKLWSQ